MKIRPKKPNGKSVQALLNILLSNPITRFSAGYGKQMQRLAYTRGQLIVSLHNSLKIHAYEAARRGTLSGKVRSLFIAIEDSDWIDIDGMRLIQLHRLAGEIPSINLSASRDYTVETTGLHDILNSVSDKASGQHPSGIATTPRS